MARKSSLSESVTLRASGLSALNDDECKRILSVIERDFKLRQKEYQRLNNIKKVIQQENKCVEYLVASKDFNQQRCIRCFKPFRILFNPKEICTECKLFVCHQCAAYINSMKTWSCRSCLKIKELEALTSNWFYLETSKKYKRCGSAKVVRELHKREKEFADLNELDDDLGYGTLLTSDSKESGSVISYVTYDKDTKRELKEYSTRLNLLVDKLQADLAERNPNNKNRTTRGKSKESLISHQQEIASEISRARVALSGPHRRSDKKANITSEKDLQDLLIQQTEQVLQTNLQRFRKNLTSTNSSINSNNFDQKLAQTIFDKCVSKEIFQELPDVIDSSAVPPPKPQRHSSTTSSLTSLTKPSSSQPSWSTTSPRTSNTSWEIKSRNDNIRKVTIPKNSTLDEEEDTEKEDEDDGREQITNLTNQIPTTITTESIQFDNGLKLDLSSIDDESSHRNNPKHSLDSDFEAISRSNSRIGDWQTNFTLIESKSSHSGEETPRSFRETVFLTIPVSNKKDLSPRVGDKPLEDLADDDLYADDESSSYQIPINTTTICEQSQISDNESTNIRKLFPLPANLILQNHSSCSFRRPSYTYESDNESVTSSIPNLAEMKTIIDEDKFRMDPNIDDPKFILRPKDTTARYGETAKFKTKISGTQPIDVFWFRFGTDDELLNNEKYQLSYDDTYHYLKIYSVDKDDEGAYLCVIANDKAQNVDMAKLYIKENKRQFIPPKSLQEFSDTDIIEGSPLALKCKLEQGYPKARVLWYKNDSLIYPNGHYKLYYYGDGQHALHVDEATIEDDNGTFTCLALNASGRVQITADVFVHEKEVIDIPRDSPIIKISQKLSSNIKLNKDILNMNYDDQDDDDLPIISSPMSFLIKNNPSDDDIEQKTGKYLPEKFKTDRSIWQNVRESTVPTIELNNNEKEKSSNQKPFYLNREKSSDRRSRSPIMETQSISQATRSKWEIRLPQLLNSTVGPDRQRRDPSRRHTTNIVFQPEHESLVFSPPPKELNPLTQSLSSAPMTNDVDNDRPYSPLVKQLKQKFDRMSTVEQNKINSQLQSPSSKFQRVASLTCRGLTSNNGERSTQKIRPMLPVRLSNETISPKQNTTTNQSKTNTQHDTGNINGQKQSDPSHLKTSVVKQLIGGGATLVYDSLNEDNASQTASFPQYHYYPNYHYQQQRKEQTTHSLKTNLTDTNKNSLTLTEKEIETNVPDNSKTIKPTNQNDSMNSDDDDEPTHQKCLILTKDSLTRSPSMSDNLSIPTKSLQIKSNETSPNSIVRSSSNLSNRSTTPAGRKSVLARAELWDRRISTNENETDNPLPTYDIEQWSNEFEKIQNQN